MHLTSKIAILIMALVFQAPGASLSILHSFGVLTNVTGLVGGVVQGPDGALYGVGQGEGNVTGGIFKVQADGSGFTVLKYFSDPSMGPNPNGDLGAAGNRLYGTSHGGYGPSANGSVFALNLDGSGFTILHSFSATDISGRNADGAQPRAGLVLSGGTLYGTTETGGSLGVGTVFKMNLDGSGFTRLHSFAGTDGSDPAAVLVLSGNTLYGMTTQGSQSGADGKVFKVNTDGTGFMVLHTFTNESVLGRGVQLVSGNTVYGTMAVGGSSGGGRVFRVNTDGTGFTDLYSFPAESWDLGATYTNEVGVSPAGLALENNALIGVTQTGGSNGCGTVFRLNLDGTGFTNLYTLGALDGGGAAGQFLVLGDSIWGTTAQGGSAGQGSIFRMNTDGTGFTTIYSARNFLDPGLGGLLVSDGWVYGFADQVVSRRHLDGTALEVLHQFSPAENAVVVSLAISGTVLYGTTDAGGASQAGTVFRINTDGSGFTNLYSFSGSDGSWPTALVASGDTLYGATWGPGAGTLFQLNTDGSGFNMLYQFSGSDGVKPQDLILVNGVLYGATPWGGNGYWPNSSDSGFGTVFQFNTDGTGFSTLYMFSGTDGEDPLGNMVSAGTTLYGTTANGGANNAGTVFQIENDGTGFTTLHDFATHNWSGTAWTNADGYEPLGPLVLVGDSLYGTTTDGSPIGLGTIYQIQTDGSGFTNLYNFAGTAFEGAAFVSNDGAEPLGLVLSGTTLYGTTGYGGQLGIGTLFALNLSTIPIPLDIQATADGVVLTWSDSGFTLQTAPAVTGVYTNIPGATSPYTNRISGGQQFFRLLAQ